MWLSGWLIKFNFGILKKFFIKIVYYWIKFVRNICLYLNYKLIFICGLFYVVIEKVRYKRYDFDIRKGKIKEKWRELNREKKENLVVRLVVKIGY